MSTTTLPAVVDEFLTAVNAQDTDRIVATFAPDAYVNDNRREIWGTEPIRAFIAKEFVGDNVTMEVREVTEHYGTSSSAPASTAPTTSPTCPTNWS